MTKSPIILLVIIGGFLLLPFWISMGEKMRNRNKETDTPPQEKGPTEEKE